MESKKENEIEKTEKYCIDNYLLTYDIGILQPNDTLEEAQKLAIHFAADIQECLSKNDFLGNQRYNYIVLVEANSENNSALAVHGKNHILKKDKYFVYHKKIHDFHFIIHVWRIDTTASLTKE